MVDRNIIFKIGISLGAIAEIAVLLGMMFVAAEEYDPTHIEAIGLAMSILSASIALSVLLVLVYNVLKWKGQ